MAEEEAVEWRNFLANVDESVNADNLEAAVWWAVAQKLDNPDMLEGLSAGGQGGGMTLAMAQCIACGWWAEPQQLRKCAARSGWVCSQYRWACWIGCGRCMTMVCPACWRRHVCPAARLRRGGCGEGCGDGGC